MSTQRTKTLMAPTYRGAYDSAQLSFLRRREFRHFRTEGRRETATAAHAANSNSSIQLASSSLGGITKSWGFDKLDNATSFAGVTGTYNNLNQISTFNAVAYTYDANGNLSSDGTRTYTYDAADRLLTITQGATTVTFAYDGMGRRLKQAVGAAETRYLWCGAAICQQRDGTDGYQKRFYAEGEYVHAGTKKYLTLTDHLSSVRDVIDITGTPTLVGSFDYRPYGAVARSWGTVTTGYTYAGLFAQTTTSLLLSTSRAYNPANGKWLNIDPIRERGGINLTAYVSGAPMSATDPLGLCGAVAKAALKWAADTLTGIIAGCIGVGAVGAVGGPLGMLAGCISGAAGLGSVAAVVSLVETVLGPIIGGVAEGIIQHGDGVGDVTKPVSGIVKDGAVGAGKWILPIDAVGYPADIILNGGAYAIVGYLIKNAKFGLLGFGVGALNQFIEDTLVNAVCCGANKDVKQGGAG